MIKILFVCYGNICRSPMAEFIMKKTVGDEGREKDFYIASAATSKYEAGMPVHEGTREILNRLGISCEGKRSVTLTAADYDAYNYLIGMDGENKRNMLKLFGGDKDGKIRLLMEFANKSRDVADPYWTGDFEATYRDIVEGTNALYKFLICDR